MSKSQRPGHSDISPLHAHVRLAPGERCLWRKVNGAVAYEDERPDHSTQRELPTHGDAPAQVLPQLAVRCASQIKWPLDALHPWLC